jgi:hypothetical protein
MSTKNPVRLDKIDDDALQEMRDYFSTMPEALQYEIKASGFDPLTHPYKYFRLELQEKDLESVRDRVNKSGRLTRSDVTSWKSVHLEEVVRHMPRS